MTSIIIQQIISGFFVKAIASFDDTLTRIPVIAQLTRGKKGKIAFSIGTLLALTVILVIVIFFSALLNLLPYSRYLIAGLIILLAVTVYFEVFTSKSNQKLENKIKTGDISSERFIKLIGIGFVISFVTLLDDSLILASLFIGDDITKFLAVIGVYLATLVQISIVIYFGQRINKFKYKKEVASFALVVLAILIILGVV